MGQMNFWRSNHGQSDYLINIRCEMPNYVKKLIFTKWLVKICKIAKNSPFKPILGRFEASYDPSPSRPNPRHQAHLFKEGKRFLGAVLIRLGRYLVLKCKEMQLG